MLLYFSSDKNISIFDEETKALGIDVKIETQRCLTDYVRANMNKLNHLEYLAIDLEYIVDDDQEILTTLSAFKVFNSSITIIIVTFERKQGDILLARLFADGIYNFITSKNEMDMSREVKICLDHTQNSYANAIGFKLDNIEEPKEKRKSFWGNVLDNFKSKNKKEEKEFKVKETKLKKEKRPKKSKEVVKDDIPTNSHKEEIYENNFYNEDDYIKEENTSLSSSIEKRPKKSKEVVKDDIPTNSHKEEIYENNFYNEDDYIKEENISSNSSITEKVKNTKEVQVNNKDIDMKINALFSKEEDSNRFITEKRRKKLDIEKLKDDVFLFYYYQKPVGIISKNTCIVDKIFEKDDIIRFFESQNIGLKFEDNVLQEIADIKSYVERGDVYDCN